jgi:hypothetical protein
VMSPLQKQTWWMLGVELCRWCQLSHPTGWQKIHLFYVSYHLWLSVLRHVLYMPTNSVIWHRDFQNLFLILLAKHNVYNYTVCW